MQHDGVKVTTSVSQIMVQITTGAFLFFFLHALPVLAWVFSVYSSFLPQSRTCLFVSLS